MVLGASPTTNGAVVHSYTAGVNGNNSNDWFGIYAPWNTLYYGISQQLPAPAGTSTLGGYFKGLGIGGSVNGTTDPIFGILNSVQTGSGLGSVAFTILANSTVETLNNVLDNGSGVMTVSGAINANGGITTSTANQQLSISANGTGNILINPNGGGAAALIINKQSTSGDIFTASSSGVTKFTIANNGDITDTSATNVNFSGATLTVASCSGCAGPAGSNFFRINSGAISPINDTLDLLIGNSATTSAKFGFLNVNSGTPTSSISAGLATTGATYINGAGLLATTNNQTLQIGNSSIGDINFFSSSNKLTNAEILNLLLLTTQWYLELAQLQMVQLCIHIQQV